MSEIHIVAELEVLPQYREAFMPELRALVDGSRGEPGNRGYELTEDVSNMCRLLVLETWASQEAVDAHNVSPHFTAFGAFAKGKLRHMNVTLLKKVF